MAPSSLPPEMGVSPRLHIPERERSVIQGQGDQQLSLVDPIALARRADMLGHGLSRYAKYRRDFRIGLALCHEEHALALAIGQNRHAHTRTMAALQPEPSRCLEREGPGAMGNERYPFIPSRAAARKGTRTARFAWHVCRNGKPTAQALCFAKSKYPVVLGGKRNEAADVRPGEALGRADTMSQGPPFAPPAVRWTLMQLDASKNSGL